MGQWKLRQIYRTRQEDECAGNVTISLNLWVLETNTHHRTTNLSQNSDPRIRGSTHLIRAQQLHFSFSTGPPTLSYLAVQPPLPVSPSARPHSFLVPHERHGIHPVNLEAGPVGYIAAPLGLGSGHDMPLVVRPADGRNGWG